MEREQAPQGEPLLLRQSRDDAQMLNKPGPAAEFCIISDHLDRLQDANQHQIKSSSKLMSNHILSVQLHSITREPGSHRRGKAALCRGSNGKEAGGLGGALLSCHGLCTAAAPAPGPTCAPKICLLPFQGDKCGRAHPDPAAHGCSCSQCIPVFS